MVALAMADGTSSYLTELLCLTLLFCREDSKSWESLPNEVNVHIHVHIVAQYETAALGLFKYNVVPPASQEALALIIVVHVLGLKCNTSTVQLYFEVL